MDLGLIGRIALVTGAGQGIGRETAKTLASEGTTVVVNDVFLERATAVADEIAKAGGKAFAIKADITKSEEVDEMMRQVIDRFGRVDILVNNAGIPVERRTTGASRGPFMDLTRTAWDLQINLNIHGNVNCTKAAVVHMIKQKYGKIVNIISDAGRVGEVMMTPYSTAKAGIIGFTKTLAQELGQHRINVNCISVGATIHEAQQIPEEVQQKILKRYPIGEGLGRLGQPSDIANAVAFMASDVSVFITGQVLSVSGGYTMVS